MKNLQVTLVSFPAGSKPYAHPKSDDHDPKAPKIRRRLWMAYDVVLGRRGYGTTRRAALRDVKNCDERRRLYGHAGPPGYGKYDTPEWPEMLTAKQLADEEVTAEKIESSAVTTDKLS